MKSAKYNVVRKTISVAALVLGAQLVTASPVICRLAAGASASTLAKKYHAKVLDTAYTSPFALIDVPTATDLKGLSTDPKIVWVEDDLDLGYEETEAKGGTIGAVGDPSAIFKQDTWLFKQINWSATTANAVGRRVRIAVLDTGLSPKQPTLWKSVVASTNLVEPGQAATDLPRGEDTNGNKIKDEATGHGTMVAGLVNLVAPKVDLVIVRVADSDGNATAWRIIKGLCYAVSMKAEVANVSLGAASEIPALSDILDWTDAHGLLVVAPVGNGAVAKADYPARYDATISVAGLDANNLKAPFSNWDLQTKVAAPSTGILSYWWDGSMGIWSGTSFASPLVAASIADSLRKTKPLTPDDLRGIVKGTGKSIDALNPK